MVQRREAVHRVACAEVGRRRSAERGQRPAEVGDLACDELAADRREGNVGEVLGETGIGPVPARQCYDVGIDLFHVDDVGVLRQIKRSRLATAEDQHPQRKSLRGLEVHRVGDDVGHPADARRRDEVAVGRHEDGHRA